MKNPISTFVLIGLNVLVFGWLAIQQRSLLMESNLDVLAIIRAGANLNPLTLGGEPWRMISSMFLHFGVIHLAVNMFSLYSLGSSLEPKIGAVRFLFIYFLCGVSANLASLIFNVYVPSAGASGAIFGLYGFLLGVEIIGNFQDRARLGSIAFNFIIFVAINAFVSSQVSVDMAGHIGGGVAGLLLAFLLHAFNPLNDYKGLGVMLVLLFSFVFVLPQGQVQYYQFFQHLVRTDHAANAVDQQTKSDWELKDSLALSILPKWDTMRAEFAHLKQVPKAVRSDTAMLSDYIRLRRQETLYRLSLIERESYIYFDSLEIVRKQLDSLPQLKFILNYEPIDADALKPDTIKQEPTPLIHPEHVYFDHSWNEVTDASQAEYYRIGSKDSLGRWQGFARDYYKDGNVQMKGKYIDGLQNGVFIYYSDHKTYESAGRYEKERRIGKWETFHWNGKMESEILYHDDVFVRSVWDSIGNPQVVKGNGKVVTWYANGNVREEGSFRNGKRQDFWHGFYPDGKPHYEELYQDNRLIRGVSVSGNGKRYAYDQSSDYPFPVGGIDSFNAYVKKNNQSLNVKISERGVVKVIFDVDINGVISNILVLEGLCSTCDQEAIRLIKDGPEWNPAFLHGHIKIKSQAYAEILF